MKSITDEQRRLSEEDQASATEPIAWFRLRACLSAMAAFVSLFESAF
jgi:hypothetical protein